MLCTLGEGPGRLHQQLTRRRAYQLGMHSDANVRKATQEWPQQTGGYFSDIMRTLEGASPGLMQCHEHSVSYLPACTSLARSCPLSSWLRDGCCIARAQLCVIQTGGGGGGGRFGPLGPVIVIVVVPYVFPVFLQKGGRVCRICMAMGSLIIF